MIRCIRDKCGGIAVYRGNCMRHYSQLSSRVRRKLTSWAEAEKAGLCLPCIRGKDGMPGPRFKERTR